MPSRWRRALSGRGPWPLVVAFAILALGSVPSIAGRAPAWVFPAVATAGAALVVAAFVRSLIHVVRGDPVPLVAVLVILVLMVVFVVMPATALRRALGPARAGAPRILARFHDWRLAEGYPRLGPPHSGIDLGGRVGTPVLAAADGRIVVAGDTGTDCGIMVVIDHAPYGSRTIYCHLSGVRVAPGHAVTRGQPIGAIGRTGERAWPGYGHVHWMLRQGGTLLDPAAKTEGCFDPTRPYPADRLVLTYPVAC